MKYKTINRKNSPSNTGSRQKILVTGATCFLGGRLVEILVDRGYQVRALARKLSNIDRLKNLNLEIYFGDIVNRDSIEPAFKEVDFVVHAAAGTSGDKKGCDAATIEGTENVISVCRDAHIEKLIYISSCSVYGVSDYRSNEIITEESSIERFPSKRGNYSASKQKAESFVINQMKNSSLPIVILRPGTIFGPGADVYTPMMGFSFMNKVFVVIGNGRFVLPFVYVDNIVDAIIKSIQMKEANSQVFNVVESERINKRKYIKKVIKKLYPKSFVAYIPYSLMYLVVFSQEILCLLLKRPPFLTRYRLSSSQRMIRYSNSKIVEALKWQPKVSIDEAIERILNYENGR